MRETHAHTHTHTRMRQSTVPRLTLNLTWKKGILLIDFSNFKLIEGKPIKPSSGKNGSHMNQSVTNEKIGLSKFMTHRGNQFEIGKKINDRLFLPFFRLNANLKSKQGRTMNTHTRVDLNNDNHSNWCVCVCVLLRIGKRTRPNNCCPGDRQTNTEDDQLKCVLIRVLLGNKWRGDNKCAITFLFSYWTQHEQIDCITKAIRSDEFKRRARVCVCVSVSLCPFLSQEVVNNKSLTKFRHNRSKQGIN